MRYDFLVETYETERIKVVSVWSIFRDSDPPRTADGAVADAHPRGLQHLRTDGRHRRAVSAPGADSVCLPDETALLAGEGAGGLKQTPPGPGSTPVTERPVK